MSILTAWCWRRAWKQEMQAHGGYLNSVEAEARFKKAVSSFGPTSTHFRAQWLRMPPKERMSAVTFIQAHRDDVSRSFIELLRAGNSVR